MKDTTTFNPTKSVPSGSIKYAKELIEGGESNMSEIARITGLSFMSVCKLRDGGTVNGNSKLSTREIQRFINFRRVM